MIPFWMEGLPGFGLAETRVGDLGLQASPCISNKLTVSIITPYSAGAGK